jgi:hypothetical protein
MQLLAKRQLTVFGLLLVIVGALWATSFSPAAATPTSRESLAGSVSTNDDSRVLLTIERHHGEPSGGTFLASNVEFRCESEDGEVLKAFDLPVVHLHFTGSRTFYGDHYEVHHRVIRFAVSIRGRLNDAGQALGPIYSFSNPPDPASGPDHKPECLLGPGQVWKAAK